MVGSASKSRKRPYSGNQDTENDQNSSNQPSESKKAKVDENKKSPVVVSPIFGPVVTLTCVDYPCFGTVSFLPNTVVVKCSICQKLNCLECKTVHDMKECDYFQATKIEAPDQEAVFKQPENMKTVEDTKSEEVAADTKAEEVKVKHEDDPEKIKVQADPEDKKEQIGLDKESKTSNDPDATKEYSFKLNDGQHSTPSAGTSSRAVKRLFSEDDHSFAEQTVDAPSPNVSSIAQDTVQDTNIFNPTFEETNTDGSIKYVCSICPYSGSKKANFQKHCKSKRHLENSFVYNSKNMSGRSQP